jgi:DNA-binding transcriptional MerR regulator
MFKIGAFSQLTGVTIKALHYYDRVGLLKPAEVDRFTGYRYYTVGQIDTLNRILAFKDLGLSLDEIGRVLGENLSAAEMRGMLRLKQAQLKQTIDEEQARLQRVEARLRQIEREGELPVHEIVMREVAPQWVLAYREIVAEPREIGTLFMRVMAALKAGNIEPVAPPLALYHHGDYREYDLDVEVAIPVAETAPTSLPLDGNCVIQGRTLPAAQVAATLCHMKSQADVYTAYHDLGIWIVENGYCLDDAPCREVYVGEPCADGSITFETQLPVKR